MRKHILLPSMLALAACATDPAPNRAGTHSAAASEFEALRVRFTEAYARADAEGVASFYTPDATYIGTAGDVVTGRDQLLVGLRREVPVFRKFQVEPAQFVSSGSMAWERGTYRASVEIPGRAPQPVSGPYLIVYERQADRTWKIKVHMSGRQR